MSIRTEQRKININDCEYSYTLRRRWRVRYVRLSIEHDGSLVLTAPLSYPIFLINRFLHSRVLWIDNGLAKVKNRASVMGIKHSEAELKKYKKITRELVKSRLDYFNQFYGFKINRIAIRNQKSRWGSCSSDKNLNFNYRLTLIPPDLADYIIVHELCHLSQMNHSKAFWQLVAQTVPDYKNKEKLLKKI
ncbi:M48 family metallopeptidase [Patescibacteria group bacterium]|nr:M48 family metallopeptidase [Patescibacteria group bacterium]